MADEVNTPTDEQEEDSLLKMLGLDDEEDDKYADLAADADDEAEKEDKMVKKMTAKMEGMQKKFEQTILRERINAFQSSADEMEVELFKTIAADVKDVETFDKASRLVRERAQKMREEAEQYKARLEEQAAQTVSRAWGIGPDRISTQSKDFAAEQAKKIEEGDESALFADLMSDFPGAV